ncbi:hypothetical protein HPB52_020430 [Rhipicephalus sanguineus]|uniref:Uncharacterized protein n=1 Tax=Rhipicephalus sanguineus TaxID=34632 RepID=A0A9D4TBG2_RHISA|nr:hypothetical protein HPB52_020430 [Rhipicephalus sanguineus]
MEESGSLPPLPVTQRKLVKGDESEFSVLNAELEAVMTDEQAIEDYESVMEYEEAAIMALALLEHAQGFLFAFDNGAIDRS